MLQELLVELLTRADNEKSVAVVSLADGIQMLAYPMETGMLVGVGLEGEAAARLDPSGMLHRRASDMARFGHWLPAQLKDGAWYVLRRLPLYPAGGALDERDLEAAAELLA